MDRFRQSIFPLTLFDGFSIFRRMSEQPSQKVIASIAAFLRPVAKILLRNGIPYKYFDQIARKVFVQVASEDYGVRGRPTNASRIAIMTGLTRKEVKQIRDVLDERAKSEEPQIRNLSSEVLHVWYTASSFLDASGCPRALPFAGSRPSFSDLVRTCGGDVPAGAMRAELKRLGAIEEQEDGSLLPLRRAVVPGDSESRVIEGFMFGLAPLADTIDFNSTFANNRRFQRVVHSERIDASRKGEVTQAVFNSLVAYSETLDTELSSFEVSSSKRAEEKVDLGVGLYFFVREKAS